MIAMLLVISKPEESPSHVVGRIVDLDHSVLQMSRRGLPAIAKSNKTWCTSAVISRLELGEFSDECAYMKIVTYWSQSPSSTIISPKRLYC